MANIGYHDQQATWLAPCSPDTVTKLISEVTSEVWVHTQCMGMQGWLQQFMVGGAKGLHNKHASVLASIGSFSVYVYTFKRLGGQCPHNIFIGPPCPPFGAAPGIIIENLDICLLQIHNIIQRNYIQPLILNH